jgi:hypothetical protein
MSLIAAAIGVDRDFMAELAHGDTALDRFTGGDDAKLVRKCDIAADEFRSAAIKGGYSEDDIDALTDETTPPRWQEIIGHLALDAVSAGGIGRAEIIKEKADQARQSLRYLAGGAETIDGLTKEEAGPRVVRHAPTERVFDRCNDSQKYNLRDPEI